jgi:hypothetical protein
MVSQSKVSLCTDLPFDGPPIFTQFGIFGLKTNHLATLFLTADPDSVSGQVNPDPVSDPVNPDPVNPLNADPVNPVNADPVNPVNPDLVISRSGKCRSARESSSLPYNYIQNNVSDEVIE